MIPLVNDNSPDAINASLIAVKRELHTLLDAIKKINPTQEIIEQGGGEITELTQSEYDALTPEQKADGTVRVISDSDQTPVDLAGLVIDDETVANNKTWSSEKLQDKVKHFPDIARGKLHTFTDGSVWTATEDCYFYDATISATSSDTPALHIKINGTDITVIDQVNWGSTYLRIYQASGFVKKGDTIQGSARMSVYGLRS